MSYNTKLACHECDLLIELPTVQLGAREVMRCPQCRHTISAGHDSPIETVIALCLTAIITLIIACGYPFISFSAQGQSRTITLFQTSTELYLQGFPMLASLVFCFVLLLPLLYLLFLLTILLPIKLQFRGKMFFPEKPILLGKLVSYLLPWSMAEVFLIGVLVALIKIVSMSDIILGVSFWAYVIFVPLFIYISAIVDSHRLWHWIEHGR